MDQPTKSIKDLLRLYKKSLNENEINKNNNIEFEIRFKEQNINKIVFENVYKKLYSSNFTNEESNFLLKIQADQIRVELSDLSEIQKYCKTDSLQDITNKIFMQKNYLNDILNKPNYNNDYGFRTSIQKEITFDENRSKIIKEILKNWSNIKKYFRFMHRISLKNNDLPNIRIDLSKVKKCDEKIEHFKDSTMLNKLNDKYKYYHYEIEIELINIEKDFDIDDIEKQIKK